jgi:hypothetical protein
MSKVAAVDLGKVKKEVLNEAKERFCNFHRSQPMIEDGVRSGYRLHISFEAIPARLNDCKSRIDRIINGEVTSTFKQEIMKSFEELGHWRAQSEYFITRRSQSSQLHEECAVWILWTPWFSRALSSFM